MHLLGSILLQWSEAIQPCKGRENSEERLQTPTSMQDKKHLLHHAESDVYAKWRPGTKTHWPF